MFKLICLSLILIAPVAMANKTSNDFNKFRGIVKSLGNQPLAQMQAFKPKENIKNYKEHTQAENYYKGVESQSDNLKESSQKELSKDKAGSVIYKNFANQTRFEINVNSDAIKNSKVIENESSDIVNGRSNENINCENKQSECKTTYHQESCRVKPTQDNKYCSDTRTVEVNKKTEVRTINGSVYINPWMNQNRELELSFNLKDGKIYINNNATQGTITPLLSDVKGCLEMKSTLVSFTHNNVNILNVAQVRALPTCVNSNVLSLYLPSRGWFNYNGFLNFTIRISINSDLKISEKWSNNCSELDNDTSKGLCVKEGQSCPRGGQTKIINGIPITRDCWEKRNSYNCQSSTMESCQAQKDKGCNQIDSICEESTGNKCTLTKQVYNCPKKHCEAAVVCAKNVFCADGNCVEKKPTQSDNFSDAASKLSTASQAGTDYKKEATIFAGVIRSCIKRPIGYLDCCSDRGWGKDLNLAKCKTEDVQIGKDKLKYLAHYVGEYCSDRKRWPGGSLCVERKRVYCTYSSKMARIIHEQGSGNFGSAESPNCKGFTPKELANIDMTKIEFIEPIYPTNPSGVGVKNRDAGIAGDIKLDTPNSSKTIEEIERRAKNGKRGNGRNL